MLSGTIPNRVYLACGSTDMRKSIDGLAAIVSFQFKLDPFADCMFVFCNRSRNKLKILYWDHNGPSASSGHASGSTIGDWNGDDSGGRRRVRMGRSRSAAVSSAGSLRDSRLNRARRTEKFLLARSHR